MSSNFETEYKAVREFGAGIFDFPSRGLIEVSGSEAVQFLNGLLTNDIKNQETYSWMWAAFPNVQGRLIALVRILQRNGKFWFSTDAATYEKVLNNLQRFTLAGDFKVSDLTPGYNFISLQGPNAANLIRETLGDAAANVEQNKIAEIQYEDAAVLVIRSNHFSQNGFDIFGMSKLTNSLFEKFQKIGAVEITAETREVLRIESGTPLYGVDMDESTVVLETGLDEAISFTKGCYIGQEVIIRIHHRGHVAKKLAGLIFDKAADIATGSELKSMEGKNAGRVTSVAFSPALNQQIALAYVRYDYLQPGTELLINENVRAKVARLPFLGANEI